MELESAWLDCRTGGRGLPAYAARPAAVHEPLPAVIVIQEVWGVDEHIRDLVHRYATAGYFAVAPDLFAHGGHRPAALAPERVSRARALLDEATTDVWRDPGARDAAILARPEPERAPLRETLALLLIPNRPIDQYTDDLVATSEFVRGHTWCSGAVGSVGYCLGGLLSLRLAGADPELRAAACYYGTSPDVSVMAGTRADLLGCYGGEDTRVTSGAPALVNALRARGIRFEMHIYPGAPHAFFNDTRPAYHVDAARAAWATTLGFLARTLAPIA